MKNNMDLGYWHDHNIKSKETLYFLAQQPEFELAARRVIEHNTRESRAVLFETLLQADKQIYVKHRRKLEKVLNPYK